MNKLCCLIIMFIACRICEGQNLVPNPSFEDKIQCPLGGARIDDATNWYHAGGSADYFNPCANAGGYQNGVPDNFVGHHYAYEGNSYAGLITYVKYFPQGYRENMGVQLTQPLTTGTKYYVSAYISRAYIEFGLPGDTDKCASNKFGFRFSVLPHNAFPYLPTDNFSHIHTDSIITDTTNWKKISGSFTADSSYQYLIIGNFYDDANTDTAQCSGGYAYYYVDMVCVSTDSLTCNSTVGINEVKNEDKYVLFPNPFTDKINITAKANELVEINLYDVIARKMFHQFFVNSISINTEQLVKGIYFYELRNNNGVIKKGKVVKE